MDNDLSQSRMIYFDETIYIFDQWEMLYSQ